MKGPLVDNPFGAEPVEEVHLPRAPLVHVVAQVRFPKVLTLTGEDGILPLAAQLRPLFPVLHQEQTVGVLLTPDGVTSQPQAETIWRLQTKRGDWQVSVGSSFLSLDTSAYVSRTDFCDRLSQVLDVFASIVEPAIAERVGLRYIDRLDVPAQLARLNDLVRAEILGGYAVPLPDGVVLGHSVCESVFVGPDSQLLARWGLIPGGAVLDPVIKPTPNPSWVLDLDVSRAGRMDFNAAELTDTVKGFADQAYRFFRWAVTDKLISESGGEL